MGGVTGAEEMQRRFAALRRTVRNEGARASVRAGAEVILHAMQERAIDGQQPSLLSTALNSGEARDDLRIRERGDALGDVVALIGPSKKTGYVWRFVEYGHRLVKGGSNRLLGNGKTQGGGQVIGEVPAYPRLRPAFEASHVEAHQACVNEMKRQIQGALK